MEYTWTLVSNSDDQGLGSETSLLNCNVQGPHSGQILILSNESNSQAIPNQALPDITSTSDKDYGANRMHANEPRKLHLMHSKFKLHILFIRSNTLKRYFNEARRSSTIYYLKIMIVLTLTVLYKY